MTNYNYMIERFSEGSTVRGIVLFISSIIAPTISSTDVDSIVYLILGAVGVLGIFLPDKFNRVSTPDKEE